MKEQKQLTFIFYLTKRHVIQQEQVNRIVSFKLKDEYKFSFPLEL